MGLPSTVESTQVRVEKQVRTEKTGSDRQQVREGE